MSLIDIIVLVIYIPALVMGIRRGLVEQAAAIISIILGVWAAFHFSSIACQWLEQYIDVSASLLNVISFSAILIAVILVLMLIAKAISGVIRLIMLGWLNRLLGAVFATFNTALALGIAFILLNTVNTNLEIVDKSYLDNSIFFHPLKDFAYVVFPYLKDLLLK